MFSASEGLALARIGFGLSCLQSAWGKTASSWLDSGAALTGAVHRNLDQADAPYRAFLTGTVLPNADLCARLVTLGEWAVGVSLALGVLTRVGALVGMWLLANYTLIKALRSLLQPAATDWLDFVTCLAFLAGSAGLTWGGDEQVARLPALR